MIDNDASYKAQTEEVVRLRKALEFYAKPDNYESWRESDFDRSDAFNFVDLDGGDTAREALAWRNTTRK